jgi:hypothetical protein
MIGKPPLSPPWVRKRFTPVLRRQPRLAKSALSDDPPRCGIQRKRHAETEA